MTRPRAGLAFILVVLLLDTLGIGVIVPVLPGLIGSFVADLGTRSRYYGVFIAVYALMQLVCAPIIGGLSDRFGRRTVILSSLLGAALDYLLLAMAPGLGWLFLGRVISGITGASFSAATAYIADVTPPEKRAQSFGLVGAAFGLGFIIGPAVGGALGDIHLRLPFFVAAGLNGVNFLYGLLVLPESLAPALRRPFSFARANPFGTIRTLGRYPLVLGLTRTLFCSFLAQAILQSTWTLYTQGRFGWTAGQVGLSLAVVGLSVAVVQGGLIRKIVPRVGERRALLLGITVNALGFAGFGLASEGWMMYLVIVPFALGGIGGPAMQALMSREFGPSEQGELQGALTSLQSLAAIAGPLLGATLFGRFGPETAVPHVPGAAFFAAAALCALGLALAQRTLARIPSTPQAAAATPGAGPLVAPEA